MKMPAAAVTSVAALRGSLPARKAIRNSIAVLNRLSLNAPRNCVTNSGAKRGVATKPASGARCSGDGRGAGTDIAPP